MLVAKDNFMIAYIGLLASTFFALMFGVLGLPLFFNKIKRNYFFGYRVSHYAMLDEDIWYAVNHQGGQHLLVMSALLTINAIFSFIFYGREQIQSVLLITDGLIIVIGFIYSLARGVHLNNELAKAKGLKNHIHPKDLYKVE